MQRVGKVFVNMHGHWKEMLFTSLTPFPLMNKS